jgi:hypothetical protein
MALKSESLATLLSDKKILHRNAGKKEYDQLSKAKPSFIASPLRNSK